MFSNTQQGTPEILPDLLQQRSSKKRNRNPADSVKPAATLQSGTRDTKWDAFGLSSPFLENVKLHPNVWHSEEHFQAVLTGVILNYALRTCNSAPIALVSRKGCCNETEHLTGDVQHFAGSSLHFTPGEKLSPTIEASILSRLISSNYS